MRWKRVVGILAAVIIVLLITAILIVNSYDYNKFKPQIAAIAKEYTGRNLTISGDLKLAIRFPLQLVVKDVAFQNAPWGSRPNMVTVEDIEIQVALLPLIKGDVRVKNLILIKPDFILEINKTGQSNLEFEVAKKPAAEAPKEESRGQAAALFGFKDITLKDGRVAFYDHRNKTRHVLTMNEFSRRAAGFKAESEIRFVGSYNDYPFRVQGRIGSLANIMDPSQKWALDLSAEAFETNFTINGSILDVINVKGIDLILTAKGNDLAKLEKITHKPLPLKGPYSFGGHLAAADFENIKVSDIKIQMGENKLNGEVAVSPKLTRPRIDAKLYSQKLDLRPYMEKGKAPEKPVAKPGTGSAKKKKVFSDKAFDFQPLQYVDANITVRVDQILLPVMAWNKIDIMLDLKNGHLVVNPLGARSGDATVSATLDLKTQRSHADLKTKISVKKASLEWLLHRVGMTGDFEGALDADITLNGQGESPASLMAGLDGDMIIILGKSEVPLEYVKFLGNMIGADFASNLIRMLNPFGEKSSKAQINCAVCDFNIQDGMAESDVIILDDPRKTLLSKGKINLKTEALDFGIYTKPKEGIGTEKTAKVSVSLSKITRPFKLSGTLANPQLAIDPLRTAETVGAALLGPVGWGYLLVSVSSDENPCVKALETAGEGKAEKKATSAKEKDSKSKTEKESEGLGSKIKRFFSQPKK